MKCVSTRRTGPQRGDGAAGIGVQSSRIRSSPDPECTSFSASLTHSCAQLPTREPVGTPIPALVLLWFIAAGADAIIRPCRHLSRHMWRGGDRLREWNEFGVPFTESVLAGGSGRLLFEAVR